MSVLSDVQPKNVFEFFEEIASIPHGSGNMEQISDYCVNFAKKRNLECFRDEARNVIIKKGPSKGYENSVPVILQGHIDMVCQKTEDSKTDFTKDGLCLYVEDGFLKAKGTTLGADNGIGAAMMLAILDDDTLMHPPIECVFTTDEEIGMLGALALDMSCLKGKRMINIDGGGEKTVTISCAGGADFETLFPYEAKKAWGTEITVTVSNLPGGHSGTQIHKKYENANSLMTKVMFSAYNECRFEIIDIEGGNKTNVITPSSRAKIVAEDVPKTLSVFHRILGDVKAQIKENNPDMVFSVEVGSYSSYDVMGNTKAFLDFASSLPSGVIKMSDLTENLVETSANFGIVQTQPQQIKVVVSVRSCVRKELDRMLEELKEKADKYGAVNSVSGIYPPWELKKDTHLQKVYGKCLEDKLGTAPIFMAIHAGLECGIFDSAIDGLDCISVGPDAFDIHSPQERLDISSAKRVYEIISEVLKNLK